MVFRILVASIAMLVLANGARAQQAVDPFGPGSYTVVSYSGVVPAYTADVGGAPSLLNGVDLAAGVQLSRYYALEVDYTYARADTSYTAEFQAFSADWLGFLPLGRGSRVALFSDVGVGVARVDASVDIGNVTLSTSKATFLPRVGGGLQYQFTNNLGLRASVRYAWTPAYASINGATIFQVGLVSRF